MPILNLSPTRQPNHQDLSTHFSSCPATARLGRRLEPTRWIGDCGQVEEEAATAPPASLVVDVSAKTYDAVVKPEALALVR